MPEIFDYPFRAHEQYAEGQKSTENYISQYGVLPSDSGKVAVQAQVLDTVAKYPAIDVLVGTTQKATWARFPPIPKDFNRQSTTSSLVAPSLGSYEQLEADVLKLRSYAEEMKETRGTDETERIEEECDVLTNCLKLGVIDTNKIVDWINYKRKEFIQA